MVSLRTSRRWQFVIVCCCSQSRTVGSLIVRPDSAPSVGGETGVNTGTLPASSTKPMTASPRSWPLSRCLGRSRVHEPVQRCCVSTASRDAHP
ncbi:hypothetical protein FKP32DRAFT_1597601 [Trametes sanguinea]|nr:hypothetical protein FKP32DRAFT_1597601 [Trametes sanguinea]